MASSSRSSRLQQLYQVLQKRYQPSSVGERSVLEYLLYAICLEGASPSVAERTLDTLVHAFYDFNEARVSSQRELSECLSELSSPQDAATCIKGVLQTLFEATYSFDLEFLRKLDVAEVYEQLKKYQGLSNFVIAYTTQAILRQNTVPVSEKTFRLLECLGVVHAEDVSLGTLPAVERVFSKTTAAEFTLLLHQLGVEYAEQPDSEELRNLLVKIFPSAEDTLPRPTLKPKEKTAKSEKKPRVPKGGVSEKPSKSEASKVSQKKEVMAASGRTDGAVGRDLAGRSDKKITGKKVSDKKVSGKKATEQAKAAQESVSTSRASLPSGTKKPLSSKPLAARLTAVKTAAKRTTSAQRATEGNAAKPKGAPEQVSARKIRSSEVAEEIKKIASGKKTSGSGKSAGKTSSGLSQKKEPPPKKADKSASTKHAVRGVSKEKKSTVAEIKKKPR